MGKHYIAEMWLVDSDKLDNIVEIETKMKEAVNEARGTILNAFSHKFSPQGVSTVITISESHLSIHTFPEANYCAVDIYTCGNTDAHKAIEHLLNHFKPGKSNVIELTRGLPNDIVKSRYLENPKKIVPITV